MAIHAGLRRAALVAVFAAAAAAFSGCWYYSAPQDSNVSENCTTKTYGFLIFHTYTATCEPTAAPSSASQSPP